MTAQAAQYQVKAATGDIEEFAVCGLSVITDNKKAAEDINALWERFFQDQIGQQITGKENDVIYAVYSDYEGDHTKPYRYTIGHKVKDLTALPNLKTVTCKSGTYAVLSAKGSQPKALIDAWNAVWKSDLDRSFATDFEVYGPRFFQEGIHEVLLYIGIKGQNA